MQISDSAHGDGRHEEEVEISGHIIDSLILPKILDCITAAGGSFQLEHIAIGQARSDPSFARGIFSRPRRRCVRRRDGRNTRPTRMSSMIPHDLSTPPQTVASAAHWFQVGRRPPKPPTPHGNDKGKMRFGSSHAREGDERFSGNRANTFPQCPEIGLLVARISYA